MLYHFSKNKALFNVQSWEFCVSRPKRACSKWLSIPYLTIETPISIFIRPCLLLEDSIQQDVQSPR